MGKFVSRLLFWLVVVGLFWLAGDRYGAPGFVTNVTDKGFNFAEAHACAAWKAVFGEGDSASDSAADGNTEAAGESAAAGEEPAAEEVAAETATSAVPPAGGIPENADLRINQAGLDIIKASEGLRLEAYSAGGNSFIGYGHMRLPGDPTSVTEAEAEALLRQDVQIAEEGVRVLLTRPATGNQFSAMVSLAYNLGMGGFGRSDVPAKFNEGDIQGAADAFRNHNRGGGVVLEHLTERREKERELFLTP